MEPEHVMLAMIKDNGIIKDYLTELRLLNQNFINKIASRVENFPKISGPINPQGLYLSNDTRRLLEIAIEESERIKDDFVGIESILLAMTKLDNSNIKTVLQDANINSNSVLGVMKKIRGNKRVDNKNAEENMKALEKYSPD